MTVEDALIHIAAQLKTADVDFQTTARQLLEMLAGGRGTPFRPGETATRPRDELLCTFRLRLL